jgi:hypothetical protein
MLKVTSGLETLSTTEKDSWGVEYPSGFQIFRGYYYDNYRKRSKLSSLSALFEGCSTGLTNRF